MSINDSIVVLGRGSSLKRVKELPKDVKQVIIVNDFSQEFEHDFIDEYMRDKEIIHFKNWCDDAILQDKLHYDKYDIRRIQVNRNSIYDLAHDQSRYLHLLVAHHYGMELGFCDVKVNEEGGDDEIILEETLTNHFIDFEGIEITHGLSAGNVGVLLDETDGDRIVTEIGEGTVGKFVNGETISGGTSNATATVLIENQRDKKTGKLKGHTGNYIPISIDGPDPYKNSLIPVTMQKILGDYIEGCVPS